MISSRKSSLVSEVSSSSHWSLLYQLATVAVGCSHGTSCANATGPCDETCATTRGRGPPRDSKAEEQQHHERRDHSTDSTRSVRPGEDPDSEAHDIDEAGSRPSDDHTSKQNVQDAPGGDDLYEVDDVPVDEDDHYDIELLQDISEYCDDYDDDQRLLSRRELMNLVLECEAELNTNDEGKLEADDESLTGAASEAKDNGDEDDDSDSPGPSTPPVESLRQVYPFSAASLHAALSDIDTGAESDSLPATPPPQVVADVINEDMQLKISFGNLEFWDQQTEENVCIEGRLSIRPRTPMTVLDYEIIKDCIDDSRVQLTVNTKRLPSHSTSSHDPFCTTFFGRIADAPPSSASAYEGIQLERRWDADLLGGIERRFWVPIPVRLFERMETRTFEVQATVMLAEEEMGVEKELRAHKPVHISHLRGAREMR